VKHITPEIFQHIISFKTTDFLFFISSSTINRFSELSTIKKYVDLNRAQVEATEYYKIHTLILEYYQNLIPKNRIYYLAPFSIKKGANIYGLIFGSGHILGMQKFLEACWKADPQRGEANFDIDRENLKPGQMGLFSGKEDQPKKVDIFENELQKGILEKRLVTDEDVYLFTIRNGFLPKHTRKITKALMDENKIKKVKLRLDSDIVKPETPKTVLEIIADGN
ncbi:MAG TPA: hypothetical protein VKI62_04530, partial [Bacteroidota bacterium]|nr:hypothetical protein [Bacteroidota bacterium]